MEKIKKEIQLIEQKIVEINKVVLMENTSEFCSSGDREFYRTLFNVNPDIKFTYMRGINGILKEVFESNYKETPSNNELPGVYGIENEGRSVINKLNTNYTVFCFLLKNVNKVIKLTTDRPPIQFIDKTPKEQKEQVVRFVGALKHYKDRIFNVDGTIFNDILKILGGTNKSGDQREQVTKSIIKRYFGDEVEVEQISGLGSKTDALGGIDLIISFKGVDYTSQVKSFMNKIETKNGILLEGTGVIKLYKTDWMIFQRGKNVLIFKNNPEIIDGNYLFPTESLLFDIE